VGIYNCLIDSHLVRNLTKDEAAILFKLYRNKKFGSNHMLEDNVLGGMSSRLEFSRAALDRLKSDGILDGPPDEARPRGRDPPIAWQGGLRAITEILSMASETSLEALVNPSPFPDISFAKVGWAKF